jgi:hypothetical protein
MLINMKNGHVPCEHFLLYSSATLAGRCPPMSAMQTRPCTQICGATIAKEMMETPRKPAITAIQGMLPKAPDAEKTANATGKMAAALHWPSPTLTKYIAFSLPPKMYGQGMHASVYSK